MANVIKIKNSGTANSAPTSLEVGELAINYADGILYYKDSSNAISILSSAISAQDVGAGVTVSDSTPSSPSSGDLWYESDTGKTFIYYDSFWVEIGGSTGGVGSTGAEDGTTTLTTKGDLLTRSASALSRLPVGATNGHVLTVDSAEASGMKWAASSGGGSSGDSISSFLLMGA